MDIPQCKNSLISKFEIDFAICPHCRCARNIEMLLQFWGEARCWCCRVPFRIEPEETSGLCKNCYQVFYRQIKRHEEESKVLLKNKSVKVPA